MVIGLEVHIELGTKTKIFCDCKTDFGSEPNTQCCPVCMGMPGTLPVLNEKVVEYAVKAGMATNCTIQKNSKQDRKNYVYPDLPKAYQISQFDLPLCEHGHLDVSTSTGEKRIGITRIHIEEDAGKLVHDEKYGTMIDCNRCGVPLIEIVSEPDIRSAEEAIAYLQKLRASVVYTGVSECKMQEGAFRCDVNLSVRKFGTEKFGTRTEMKNLNSFSFITKAIEYEYKRQIEAIESGEEIVQETRRFDANSGKTFSMRKKENANDYRYFPDPDLPVITLTDDLLTKYKSEIPTLPHERKKEYMDKYALESAVAELIVTDKSRADFFEEVAKLAKNPKNVANLLTSELLKLTLDEDIKISASSLAEISNMFVEEVINSNTCKKLVKEVFENSVNPIEFVEKNNLQQINDRCIIEEMVTEVIAKNEKSVNDYKNGKKNAMASLIGQVMRQSGGKANPVILNEIMMEKI